MNKIFIILNNIIKKLKNYIFSIKYFQNFIEILSSFIYFILLKFLSKNSRPTIRDKTFIVAGGPSLNIEDLKKISNSTVLLLNLSYQLSNYINENNDIYFFCNDMITLDQITQNVDKKIKKIKKIIVVDKPYINLNILKLLLKFRKNEDFLILPKYKLKIFNLFKKGYCARKSNENLNFHGIFISDYYRPKIILNEIKKKNQITNIFPYSVVFNAIMLVIFCGTKKIVTLGFDGGAVRVEEDQYSKNLDIKSYKSYGNINLNKKKRLHRMNFWTKSINIELKKRDVEWVNFSKLSNINTIPNLKKIDF